MVREKKTAAAAKAKPAAKKKATPKASVEEFDSVVVCKDFVGVRWEITEEGQLATWQPEEDGRPTLSIVPGKISDVVYDKTCGFVSDDGLKKTVRKQKATKNNLRS